MEKYLIDIYDGMDMPDIQMEEGIETERVQQDIKNAVHEMGEGGSRGEALKMDATCGNVELNKRKPPD